MISKEEYIDYAGKGFNLVPIIKELEIDSDSPIILYSKIKNKSNTFLLESIEGGIKWAQYSIIGLDCTDSIKISDNFIEISENGEINSYECEDPLVEINRIISENTNLNRDIKEEIKVLSKTIANVSKR